VIRDELILLLNHTGCNL